MKYVTISHCLREEEKIRGDAKTHGATHGAKTVQLHVFNTSSTFPSFLPRVAFMFCLKPPSIHFLLGARVMPILIDESSCSVDQSQSLLPLNSNIQMQPSQMPPS